MRETEVRESFNLDPMRLAGVRPRSAAAREWQILHWIGRIGVVTIEHVRERFGLGRTVAYRRIAACVESGLLERIETLRGLPVLIRATRRGLRYTGLTLSIAQAPAELIGHWIACGTVTLELEREFGSDSVLSEREIRRLEAGKSAPAASAVVGEKLDGSRRLHLPDMAILGDKAVVAIEVELSPKSPQRLEEIIRGWRRARWVDVVRYYTAAGSTWRGVERAVARAHAADRVELLPVEEVMR